MTWICDCKRHMTWLAEYGGLVYRRCTSCGMVETRDRYSDAVTYFKPAVLDYVRRLEEELAELKGETREIDETARACAGVPV